MSVTSTTRLATIDKIAAEMDRRGRVIEALEAELAAIKVIAATDADAVDHVLHRATIDGRLAYLIGPPSETFAKLTGAAAHRRGFATETAADEWRKSFWANCFPVRVKPAYDD